MFLIPEDFLRFFFNQRYDEDLSFDKHFIVCQAIIPYNNLMGWVLSIFPLFRLIT